MMWRCCCAPPEDGIEEVFERSPGVKILEQLPLAAAEGSVPTLLSRGPAAGCHDAVHEGPLPVHQEAHGQSPARVSGASDFLETVVAGRKCTRFADGTGTPVAAEYCIDDATGRMILTTGPHVEDIAVASIEDIFQMADGEGCFPRTVSSKLSFGEHAALFMLVYKDGHGKEHFVCLVEESEVAKDELLNYLNVLSHRVRPK